MVRRLRTGSVCRKPLRRLCRAPPLNGIWATAPYLHNGSVPTLWHLLHPAERPAVWKRTEDGYDQARIGLEVTTFETVPANVTTAAEKREYFDTHLTGKSAAGHPFPDELTGGRKNGRPRVCLKTL